MPKSASGSLTTRRLSFITRHLNVSVRFDADGRGRPDKDCVMRRKIVAFLVIVAASGALFVVMRGENRADAAAGDCYSAAQGPNTPTICG